MEFHREALPLQLVEAYLSTMSIGLALSGLIWHYLHTKPLGMQTFYDLVLKDLMCIVSLTNVVYTLSLCCGYLFWPIPTHLAKFILFTTICTIFLMCTLLLVHVSVWIRYMSVYHTTAIDYLDEQQAINSIRMLVLGIVMFTCIARCR
jgi:hypothetical protein